MANDLNKTLIAQALGFHGLPLVKAWNEENTICSLQQLGFHQNNTDTTVYLNRLKSLNIEDRSKRLRLHQFICSKANTLFATHYEDPSNKRIKKLLASGGNLKLTALERHANDFELLGDIIPPLEFFARVEKEERLKRFFAVCAMSMQSVNQTNFSPFHFRT